MTAKKSARVKLEKLLFKPRVAEFASVLDIFKYFEQHPTRLIDYIETALERGNQDPRFPKGNAVPGFHIAQLARLVNMPLKAGDQTFSQLPECFVQPSRFENIGLILTMARALYPRPLSA